MNEPKSFWQFAMHSMVDIMSVGAVAGSLIAYLTSIVFNPVNKLLQSILGAIASTIIGCVTGFSIYIFQIP